MKIIHIKKPGGLRSDNPWVVVEENQGHELQVEDDVDAPLGWLWDRDYRSGRPIFTEPQ